MLFNSLTFILFFLAVLTLYSLPLSWRYRKLILLLASYLFYAAWNPPFVLLLWISTLVDWFVARRLHEIQDTATRRLLLWVSLLCNLGLLGFFKYGGFVLDNFVLMARFAGIDFTPAAPNIVLPVGISFYTFQTLSYTLDVYRRQLRPSYPFLDYALYVTFFPQLIAGPIVRAAEFLPQFERPPKRTLQQFLWGIGLITLGLFQKVVLADGPFAFVSDMVFGSTERLSALDAWVGALAFSGQIFCDFAGYTTCAIGVALCLGFALPKNFRSPYGAVGFSDFWRRWHISLSSWLRDYLYIPLGGSRGSISRTYVNLMLTMILGGLWHGASWTFVVWGGLHGMFLVAERALKRAFGVPAWARNTLVQMGLALFTFAGVTIAWVPFRAPDFATAVRLLVSMSGLQQDSIKLLDSFDMMNAVQPMIALVILHWLLRERSFPEVVGRIPAWLIAVLWALMIIGICLMQGVGGAFLYFQF